MVIEFCFAVQSFVTERHKCTLNHHIVLFPFNDIININNKNYIDADLQKLHARKMNWVYHQKKKKW